MSEALLHGDIVLCSPGEDLVGVARQAGFPAGPATDPVVLTTDELSLTAVREAIATGAAALVSMRGNFAAHGVNLLRAYVRNTGQQITVVVGVPALPVPGSSVRITPAGELIADFTDFVRVSSKRHRSRTEVSADTLAVQGRCYWPHRRYDVLTASLMMPGIAADASALAGKGVSLRRTETGHLWFGESAPSPSRLTQLALDAEGGMARLQTQADLYERLMADVEHARLGGIASLPLADLANLIEKYFSMFILYHDDYDEILATLISDDRYADIMRSRITDWMLQTGIDLPLRKDLLEEGDPLPLPPFSPMSDMSLAGAAYESPPDRFAAAIYVVKEWKFFINKLLFREFSVAVRAVVPERSLESVRTIPVAELCAT